MEFLVIGNIPKDLCKTKDKEEFSFGGTSYCGIVAAYLEAKSKILTRGNAELSDWIKSLKEKNVEVILQNDKNITYFVNDYSGGGEREQLLLGYTKKIDFNIDGKFDIIHVNPMFREIDLNLVKKARKRCEFLSIDVQGTVRDIKDKHVIGRFWSEREEFLPFVDFLKVGKQEINLISKLGNHKKICEELHSLGAKIIAITFGNKGSLVYDGRFYELPIFKTKTIDETGAGDVYATAFLIRYFETKDTLDSALFATAAASFVVEDFGPRSIAKRKDVEKRYEILKQQLT
jgi:sugar/nucleoside kinase (ribokinase family)